MCPVRNGKSIGGIGSPHVIHLLRARPISGTLTLLAGVCHKTCGGQVAGGLALTDLSESSVMPRRGGNSGVTNRLTLTIVARDVAPRGGMDLQIRNLIEHLLGAGHHVTLISQTCAIAPHPLLRWVRVPGPGRPATIAQPWFLIVGSLITAFNRRGVLHTVGAIVVNVADVAVVHHCHHAAYKVGASVSPSRPAPWYRLNSAVSSWMARVTEQYCYRRSRTAVLVATSPRVAAEVRGHFPGMKDHVELIPNGVDTATFEPDALARAMVRERSGLDQQAFVALFLGGDWDRKGLRVAIEALRNAPAVHLLVVGHGHRPTYTDLASRHGVTDRVHFVGVVPHTPSYYAAADAFVLPSAYETFSLPSYEAAASGLPLIATSVGGIDMILRHGVNGWYVNRNAADVARRLEQLRLAPTLRLRMGIESRRMVQEFSWKASNERWVELYCRLCTSMGQV